MLFCEFLRRLRIFLLIFIFTFFHFSSFKDLSKLLSLCNTSHSKWHYFWCPLFCLVSAAGSCLSPQDLSWYFPTAQTYSTCKSCRIFMVFCFVLFCFNLLTSKYRKVLLIFFFLANIRSQFSLCHKINILFMLYILSWERWKKMPIPCLQWNLKAGIILKFGSRTKIYLWNYFCCCVKNSVTLRSLWYVLRFMKVIFAHIKRK